ncbi:hypothetical protein vBCbaSRXM_50 [Citromicrobium phage vB_CbaS-RXM]|nr:hypothetical protein vBCbaSRXM_50 [Citromicrobium phage vB_CbaS-RXM]
MRTIPAINSDIAAVLRNKADLDETRKQRIAEATKQIDADLAEQFKAVRERAAELSYELEDAKRAAASHPLEGRIVEKVEQQWGPGYRRAPARTVTLRAKVKVIRDYAEMPERPRNRRYYDAPEIGDVILHRINAKGEELTAFEKLMPDGKLPADWKLVEETEA